MQVSELFGKDECNIILNGIETSVGTTTLDLYDRKYTEWLIVDTHILELVLSKIKQFGIINIKEGRILKYETGSFFDKHVDSYEKHPHRYKTVIIQLSHEADYVGGNMWFGNEVLDKKIGTTVIFDSKTIHGMEVIKSGTRYSFVIWLDRTDFGINKKIL